MATASPLHMVPPYARLEAVWQERLLRLRAVGTVTFDEVPTAWQIHQACTRLWAFTTLRQEEDIHGGHGTFLSHFPQRGIAQFLSGTYALDPTGLSRSLDGLIWHVLSLNHYNREAMVFDLQMLTAWDDGLRTLTAELEGVVAGTHPQTWLIRQMVGDDTYHAMVLEETEKAQRGEFMDADPEDNLQGMVDIFLTYPPSPTKTLSDGERMQDLAGNVWRTVTNLAGALSGGGGVHTTRELRRERGEAV